MENERLFEIAPGGPCEGLMRKRDPQARLVANFAEEPLLFPVPRHRFGQPALGAQDDGLGAQGARQPIAIADLPGDSFRVIEHRQSRGLVPSVQRFDGLLAEVVHAPHEVQPLGIRELGLTRTLSAPGSVDSSPAAEEPAA